MLAGRPLMGAGPPRTGGIPSLARRSDGTGVRDRGEHRTTPWRAAPPISGITRRLTL